MHKGGGGVRIGATLVRGVQRRLRVSQPHARPIRAPESAGGDGQGGGTVSRTGELTGTWKVRSRASRGASDSASLRSAQAHNGLEGPAAGQCCRVLLREEPRPLTQLSRRGDVHPTLLRHPPSLRVRADLHELDLQPQLRDQPSVQFRADLRERQLPGGLRRQSAVHLEPDLPGWRMPEQLWGGRPMQPGPVLLERHLRPRLWHRAGLHLCADVLQRSLPEQLRRQPTLWISQTWVSGTCADNCGAAGPCATGTLCVTSEATPAWSTAAARPVPPARPARAARVFPAAAATRPGQQQCTASLRWMPLGPDHPSKELTPTHRPGRADRPRDSNEPRIPTQEMTRIPGAVCPRNVSSVECPPP